MYTVGLALCTLGNIASAEMARDLAPEVEKLLGSSNSYVKKKAALCAVRILRKVPDLVDQFIPRAKALLGEKNHAVLLTGMALVNYICEICPDSLREFRPLVPQLTRNLKTLVTTGNSPEHDVSGINDPFLQVKTLRLLRVLGKGDREASDAMNDVLAQIATNTEGSRNVGNAILYETCLTIMDIEADSSLRVLAVNILGRFLANTDNNIRYVALNTLAKTVTVDMNAVQRHRNTVLECLHDSDISIRRRALDLSFILVNESNVRVMVRELLIFLEVADNEFKASMPSRICAAADMYAPNKRWHIDTVIRVLKLAGNHVKEDVLSNFIKIVANTPDLHSYAVYKLFYSIKQDLSQESLVVSAVWCIGEFGEVLIGGAPKSLPLDDPSDETAAGDEIKDVSDKDVIDLLEGILDSSYTTEVITEYTLTALLKLTTRVRSEALLDRIKSILRRFTANSDLEIQQRSVEFSTLLTNPSLAQYRAGILERMPVPQPVSAAERKAQLQVPSTTVTSTNSSPQNKQPTGGNLLDDLLSLNAPAAAPVAGSTGGDLLNQLGGLSLGGPAAAPAAAAKPVDLLADVFGTSSQPPISSGPKSTNEILGLFGQTNASSPSVGASKPVDPFASLPGASPTARLGSTMSSTSVSPSNMTATSLPISPNSGEVTAFDKHGLIITMKPSSEPAPDPSSAVCSILCTFKNTNASASVTDLQFLVAVPKNLRLQVMPASGTQIAPAQGSIPSTVTQIVKVLNPSGATPEGRTAPCRLRLKLAFHVSGGQAVDEVIDFGGFGAAWTWS